MEGKGRLWKRDEDSRGLAGKEGLSCGRQMSGRVVRQTGTEGCMGTGLDQEDQNCAAFRQYAVPPLVVGLRGWAELCVA